LEPDNQNYLVRGELYGKEGKDYILKYETSSNVHFFVVNFSKKISTKKMRKLRIGESIEIVGKFIDTIEYETVAGTVRYAPKFSAYYMTM
jgi:hypothetical protein